MTGPLNHPLFSHWLYRDSNTNNNPISFVSHAIKVHACMVKNICSTQTYLSTTPLLLSFRHQESLELFVVAYEYQNFLLGWKSLDSFFLYLFFTNEVNSRKLLPSKYYFCFTYEKFWKNTILIFFCFQCLQRSKVMVPDRNINAIAIYEKFRSLISLWNVTATDFSFPLLTSSIWAYTIIIV